MKKKSIILIVAAIVLIAAITYVWILRNNSWTENIGIGTVSGRNMVYMNLPQGTTFYAGYGQLTVSEGKHIHVEYALDSGSFDLAFRVYAKGNDRLAVQSPVFKNLQNSGEIFGKSGVSGKGTLDFDVVPDTYEVHFRPHDVVGSATVTEKAN